MSMLPFDIHRRLDSPSPTGMLRWHTGHYDGYPCTCKPSCPNDCRGSMDDRAHECECEACTAAWLDYLET